MRHYLALSVAMMVTFLVLFGLVEAAQVPLLTDPMPWLEGGGTIAALISVGLLTGDVFLPVPASIVMVANGALFGAPLGAALSVLGGLGAAWVGFAIGRRGGPLLDRLIDGDERQRCSDFIDRWGDLAVAVTRPVPIVAETVAIVAGTSPMGWLRVTIASFAGLLAPALAFALTGATAARFDNMVVVFLVVLLLAGGAWLLGRRLRGQP